MSAQDERENNGYGHIHRTPERDYQVQYAEIDFHRMQKAVMLGNYEFYYGAGVAGKIGGFEIPDDIKPLDLRELLDQNLDQISPRDEKETYLIHILKEFRPDELYDGQMKELLLWGKGEQYLWSVNIPQ